MSFIPTVTNIVSPRLPPALFHATYSANNTVARSVYRAAHIRLQPAFSAATKVPHTCAANTPPAPDDTTIYCRRCCSYTSVGRRRSNYASQLSVLRRFPRFVRHSYTIHAPHSILRYQIPHLLVLGGPSRFDMQTPTDVCKWL